MRQMSWSIRFTAQSHVSLCSIQAPGHSVQLFRQMLGVTIRTVNKHAQLVKNVLIGLEGNTTVGRECQGSYILIPTNGISAATGQLNYNKLTDQLSDSLLAAQNSQSPLTPHHSTPLNMILRHCHLSHTLHTLCPHHQKWCHPILSTLYWSYKCQLSKILYCCLLILMHCTMHMFMYYFISPRSS